MRHIDLMNNPPDSKLIIEGLKLTATLQKLSPEERDDFIDKNAEYWGKLKEYYLKLSYGKCWYTEAKEISSHMHMDHFRPKKEVSPLTKRAPCVTTNSEEAYWWLAFDWKNYRLSSSVPNTSKGTYFPLLSGTKAAQSPDEIGKEFYGLLDPTDEYDVSMITFDEAGHVKPACDDTTWDADRVRLSVRVYDLDHVSLVDERIKVQNNCKRKIRQLISAQRNYANTRDCSYRDLAKELAVELRNMTLPEAELSAVARNYIRSYREDFIKNLAL